MAKKKTAKRSAGSNKFFLTSLHTSFDKTIARLKNQPSTPARTKLLNDLNNAKTMVKCDQGMYRQIGVATK